MSKYTNPPAVQLPYLKPRPKGVAPQRLYLFLHVVYHHVDGILSQFKVVGFLGESEILPLEAREADRGVGLGLEARRYSLPRTVPTTKSGTSKSPP